MKDRRTRRAAIRDGLVVAGGAVAAAAGPPLYGAGSALAKAEDASALLTRAIELEQTSVVTYRTLAGGDLLEAEVRRAAELFADQEQLHVDALVDALEERGGTRPEPPKAARVEGLDGLDSQADALEFAIELENKTVVVYDRIAAELDEADLVKTAAQIVGNEAQHLVVLRQQLGEDPVPDAFEAGKGEEE